nr:Gfo/Idh/MocA family oxidoreductase [Maliibacterium massiliense]
MRKINVGIVGVGTFARGFIRCYLRHPSVGAVYVCARNRERLDARADMLGIDPDKRYTDFDAMLQNPDIDAIHVLTPTFEHYDQQMRALAAGKYVACAVAMGQTIDQLKDIVRLRRRMGKTFMLMETSAYSRDMLKVKRMIAAGELGRVQFISGSHMQNTQFSQRDPRWLGYPPMLYGSHAAVPLYAITGKLAESVVCFGSGNIGAELAAHYNCPDAYEVTLVSLKDSDVRGEVHRSMFYALRQFREHFDVYGSKASYEWEQVIGEGAAIHYGEGQVRREIAKDDTEGLPESLIYKGEKTRDLRDWLSMPVDSEEYALRIGHYGSYPHLVHEFVSACIEDRDSYLDAEVAANITAIGILAVESARRNGERMFVPDFTNV